MKWMRENDRAKSARFEEQGGGEGAQQVATSAATRLKQAPGTGQFVDPNFGNWQCAKLAAVCYKSLKIGPA